MSNIFACFTLFLLIFGQFFPFVIRINANRVNTFKFKIMKIQVRFTASLHVEFERYFRTCFFYREFSVFNNNIFVLFNCIRHHSDDYKFGSGTSLEGKIGIVVKDNTLYKSLLMLNRSFHIFVITARKIFSRRYTPDPERCCFDKPLYFSTLFLVFAFESNPNGFW